MKGWNNENEVEQMENSMRLNTNYKNNQNSLNFLNKKIKILSNEWMNQFNSSIFQLKWFIFFFILALDFNEYLKPILQNINELTPLSDGDYERGNQGDEDY